MGSVAQFFTSYFLRNDCPVFLHHSLVTQICICSQNGLKDGLNYGLYLPESNGRSGKFLHEERPLEDYPLPGPIAHLEVNCLTINCQMPPEYHLSILTAIFQVDLG